MILQLINEGNVREWMASEIKRCRKESYGNAGDLYGIEN